MSRRRKARAAPRSAAEHAPTDRGSRGRAPRPGRPHATGEEASGAAPGPVGPLGWRRVLLLALAAGVWTGLLEEIPILVAPYGHVVVRLGRDFVWMTPLGDVLSFLAAATLLLALGRRWPRATARPAVVGTFAGLCTLSLGLVPERLYPAAVLVLAVGVGVQAHRMTRGPARRPRLAPRLALGGVLLVALLTARMEWGRWVWRKYWMSSLPVPTAAAPNVLLLILDTVRGASLDFLDHPATASDVPPVHTPVLDSLAGESVVFTRAIAPSPWTLPSHASMFTGAWPTSLWGRSRLGAEWMQGLGPAHPVVAEALARHGYLTGGFVGNLTFTSAGTGLDRGFLEYEDYPVSLGQTVLSTALGRRLAGSTWLRSVTGWHELLDRKDAREVADEFLGWQASDAAEGRPWFAFVNFFDAHEPYFPPDSVKRAMPRGSHWDDFVHFAGLLTGSGALRREKWAMDPAERAAHAAGYNAGILRIDTEIGRMLTALERRGALENTVVLIASDHGEQLGEHDLYDHNNSLYMQALHVPLIVHDPRAPAAVARVGRVVSLRDVGATLLTLAGIDPAREGIGGRSLSRYWAGADSGRAAAGADTAFASLSRGSDNRPWYPVSWGPSMYSLVDSSYHYVLNGDGSEELYDTHWDPAERRNLVGGGAAKGVVDGFRRTLGSLVSGLPAFQEGPVAHPGPPAATSGR
jgi:arylsulfatase A-like enzyme